MVGTLGPVLTCDQAIFFFFLAAQKKKSPDRRLAPSTRTHFFLKTEKKSPRPLVAFLNSFARPQAQ